MSFEKELHNMHRFLYAPDWKIVLGLISSQRWLDLIKINMGLKICLILQAQARQDTQVLLQTVAADSPWSAMVPQWYCYLGNSRQSGIDLMVLPSRLTTTEQEMVQHGHGRNKTYWAGKEGMENSFPRMLTRIKYR